MDVTSANLADGLGMPRELFDTIHEGIKQKVAHHMTLQGHEEAHHLGVLALEKIFEVHVPRTAAPVVVRRIFTVKARADYRKIINGWTDPDTKVTLTFDQISDMLKNVGARPPLLDANQVSLTCYGILWEANNPVCRNCDLNPACKAEAAAVGLLDVALSPKLLPAPAKVRTAHKTDEGVKEPVKAEKPIIAAVSLVEEELVNYMRDNFQVFNCYKNEYYTHRGTTSLGSGVSYLFWMGRIADGKRVTTGAQIGHLRLSFVDPCPEIKGKLEKISGSYYLPLGVEYPVLVQLTKKHADQKPSSFIFPRKKPTNA